MNLINRLIVTRSIVSFLVMLCAVSLLEGTQLLIVVIVGFLSIFILMNLVASRLVDVKDHTKKPPRSDEEDDVEQDQAS